MFRLVHQVNFRCESGTTYYTVRFSLSVGFSHDALYSELPCTSFVFIDGVFVCYENTQMSPLLLKLR